MIKLAEFDAVVAVSRHGNFRAAARELGMSASALSQAVAAMEQRLNVRLFNRTTRSVSLTEAGELFVAGVAPALTDLRVAMERAGSHGAAPTGTLRLNTSIGAARQVFEPLILEYMRRHPTVKVEIVTEGKLVDIVVDGFDAGLRLIETVPKDMIAVPLGPDQRMVVVGSPDVFARHPRPKVPTDLLGLPCIRARMANGSIYRWEFERRGETTAIDVQGPITLDEMGLMREAVLAGVGLAYMSAFNVQADLAAGRLVQVLDAWTPAFPGLALYYPNRRHVSAALRALIDLIKEVRPRRAPPPKP